MKYTTIPLHRIDVNDKTYDIGYRNDLELLKISISRSGIVDPVIILDVFENHYKIVSGFNRIKAAQNLSLIEIPVLIYSAYDKSGKELFIIHLEHNYPDRIYNPVEKGIILHKAVENFGFNEIEIIEIIHPFIRLDKNLHDLSRYNKVVSYSERLKESIAEGRITLDAAKHINEFSSEDFESILLVIEKLNPSASNQKIMIDFLEKISLKDSVTINKILKEVEISEIIEDMRMTQSQKCSKFMDIIKSRNLPLYSKAEEIFRELKKKLKLPPKVQLEHSPFFENPDFEVRIKAGNTGELSEILKKLSDLTTKQEFSDIFHIDELIQMEVEN